LYEAPYHVRCIGKFDVWFRCIFVVLWIAMLLDRWNWWLSALSKPATRAPFVVSSDLATARAAGSSQSRSEGGPS
jgi:hypothetical protein